MCGCNKGAAGGGTMWSSNRTRWRVTTPSGAQVTYGNREDAVRHASLHNGTVTEVRPGTKPNARLVPFVFLMSCIPISVVMSVLSSVWGVGDQTLSVTAGARAGNDSDAPTPQPEIPT